MQLNLVCYQNYYQYHIIGIINKRIVPILIDTGASWSHVSKEYCDNFHSLPEKRVIQTFDNSEKELSQYSNILLQISGMKEISMSIIIDEEPNKVLLGIDFLENFRYLISSDYLLLSGIRIERYKLSEETIKSLI